MVQAYFFEDSILCRMQGDGNLNRSLNEYIDQLLVYDQLVRKLMEGHSISEMTDVTESGNRNIGDRIWKMIK